MTISVIIPVYNVYDYLERCVYSVIDQTYSDLEIILINDGSTDKSGKLCEELKEKDSRIVVIHKDNEGLSATRNLGMKVATGDYIAFLDSDDFIMKDSFERLMSYSEQGETDVIIGGVLEYYSQDNIRKLISRRNKNPIGKSIRGEDFLKTHLKNKTYTPVVYQGVYKKELIDQSQIYFETGRVHEDELWFPQIMLNADKVIDTNEYFYMYAYREESITNTPDQTENILDLHDNIYILEKELNSTFKNYNTSELRDYLVTLYLAVVHRVKLNPQKIPLEIDFNFLNRNANSTENKSAIFLLKKNPKIYYQLVNSEKKLFSSIKKVLHRVKKMTAN